jgi:hypothetical protein
MVSRAVPGKTWGAELYLERCLHSCTVGIGNRTVTSKADTKAVPGKAGKAGRVRRVKKVGSSVSCEVGSRGVPYVVKHG